MRRRRLHRASAEQRGAGMTNETLAERHLTIEAAETAPFSAAVAGAGAMLEPIFAPSNSDFTPALVWIAYGSRGWAT
jgi:hypothetical protein